MIPMCWKKNPWNFKTNRKPRICLKNQDFPYSQRDLKITLLWGISLDFAAPVLFKCYVAFKPH